MVKYDFGYEIQKGSTNEWAFNSVAEYTMVLELGSSIGTLAKHLSEDKGCIVDLVEIDAEAGESAKAFARKAKIGSIEGNLEADVWYQEFEEKSYDYVIILDVLEHVKNPEEILGHVKRLLKDEGTLLSSIPNIAHNSILINLFNNKFEYTDVGLLDSTHIHFYTFENIQNLLRNTGLIAYEKYAVQVPVTMTEIANSYENVSAEVEEALRTREGADIYQFLFKIKKQAEDDSEEELKMQNLNSTLYQMYFYWDGKAEGANYFAVNPEAIDVWAEIPSDEQHNFVRIDPIELPCVIWNLKVTAQKDDSNIAMEMKTHNGIRVGENSWAFCDGKPELIFELLEGFDRIHVSCCCRYIKSDVLQKIKCMNSRYEMELVHKDYTINELNQKVENLTLQKENLSSSLDWYKNLLRKRQKKSSWKQHSYR